MLEQSAAGIKPRWARTPVWRAAGLGILALAVFAAIPAAGSAYAVQFATDTLIFAALAYGWNLISGFAGYLSFGQVSFYGIGAYATGLLVVHTSLPWYVAIGIGGLLATLLAAILGPILLRVRGILFALSMLGLGRILMVLFSDWDYAGGGNGMTLPAVLTPIAVYSGAVLLAVSGFAISAWLARSGFGLDAMSIREDESAAGTVGVAAGRVKVATFCASAALAGLAGGLVAWNRSYIDPPSVFDPTIDLQTVVFVLFGGIGTVWGPLIGTLILMIIGQQLLVSFPDLELALYGLLVIVIVRGLPGGTVSLTQRWGWLKRPIVLAPPELPDAEPPRPRAKPETRLQDDRSRAAMLDINNLSVTFGGLIAVDRVSFAIAPGETVAIIGANGAGKTTLFNAIFGLVKPSAGVVRFQGRAIARLPPYKRARFGMARTFQIPRLMQSLTVWENVLAAARHGGQSHRAISHAAWVIRTIGLAEMWLEPIARLTPGQQRLVEFARVLALNPDLVLLDEVMAGMTREEQEEVRRVIRRLRQFGVGAVAMVEHAIAAIADLVDRMIVLDFGRKIADDVPARVLHDPQVIRAYLGDPQA